MSTQIPNRVYTVDEIRRVENAAISTAGIPGRVLMKRAGRAAYSVIDSRYAAPHPLVVLCGSGNNGGDGYVVAGLAAQRRRDVKLFAATDSSTLPADAADALSFAQQSGVEIVPLNTLTDQDLRGAVVVDALLGIGAKGPLRSPFDDVCARVNRLAKAKVALDIPSGLNADTGDADPAAVVADLTISFIAAKRGLVTGRGPALCGELFVDDLQLTDADGLSAVEGLPCLSRQHCIPERPGDAHKGMFGTVLIIGGDAGMGGAALLAAEAALVSGVGKVLLATREQHVSAALTRLPEVMTHAVESGEALTPLLALADIIVIGPGLGSQAWGEQMLHFALGAGCATVLDADALNLLTERPKLVTDASRNWIMTPHPGEAARLLGVTVSEVQRDRFYAVSAIAQQWRATTVLKGAGTLICDSKEMSVAPVGNPGMAVAGMGDVLSGAIGAIWAQTLNDGLAHQRVAETAVCAHGYAGNRAADLGQKGLRASQLCPYLREYLNLSERERTCGG